MSTSCISNFQSDPSTGAIRHVYDIFGEIANRLLRSNTSFFDTGTSPTTSARDPFDIVRDYYVFERVYKSFARSISSLYDTVRYTTTSVRN